MTNRRHPQDNGTELQPLHHRSGPSAVHRRHSRVRRKRARRPTRRKRAGPNAGIRDARTHRCASYRFRLGSRRHAHAGKHYARAYAHFRADGNRAGIASSTANYTANPISADDTTHTGISRYAYAAAASTYRDARTHRSANNNAAAADGNRDRHSHSDAGADGNALASHRN